MGGGFSGTVVAALLLERSADPLRVLLFDRSGVFGAGVAYGTDEPCHLLNVPAAKMSAFEERPDHFAAWLASQGTDPGDGFVARRLYRRYLQSLLAQPPRHVGSEVRPVAASVARIGRGFRVHAGSEAYAASAVVLATGYLRETAYGREGTRPPFAPESWPERVRRAAIVGSGLTALDAAASVFARHPGARVVLVSRHGLLPQPFELGGEPCVPSPFPTTARALLAWIREETGRVGGWTSVFDALRPRWEDIWQALDERERRRFVSHLARRFDVHRHRVPPALHAALAPRWADGSLSVRRGRVVEVDPAGAVLADGSRVRAELAIDASGFSFDWTRTADPLIRGLLADGLAHPGPLGMGAVTDAEGLYALGPPLRGQRWETTAVPEIRRQAARIVEAILATGPPRGSETTHVAA